MPVASRALNTAFLQIVSEVAPSPAAGLELMNLIGCAIDDMQLPMNALRELRIVRHH